VETACTSTVISRPIRWSVGLQWVLTKTGRLPRRYKLWLTRLISATQAVARQRVPVVLQPVAVPLQAKAVPLQPEAAPLQPEAVPLQPEAVPLQPEAVPLQQEAVGRPRTFGGPSGRSPALDVRRSLCSPATLVHNGRTHTQITQATTNGGSYTRTRRR